MEADLISALEKKRAELRLSQTDFAVRLKLARKERSAASYYSQIVAGSRSLPKGRYSQAANLLGITVDQVRILSNKSNAAFGLKKVGLLETKLDADDLKYLAGISEAAGQALPLSLLLEHFSLRKKAR